MTDPAAAVGVDWILEAIDVARPEPVSPLRIPERRHTWRAGPPVRCSAILKRGGQCANTSIEPLPDEPDRCWRHATERVRAAEHASYADHTARTETEVIEDDITRLGSLLNHLHLRIERRERALRRRERNEERFLAAAPGAESTGS